MNIGIWQVVLILLIVVILFGAGKLPRVMGDVAKGIKTFKSGMREEVEDAHSTPMAAARRATFEVPTSSSAPDPQTRSALRLACASTTLSAGAIPSARNCATKNAPMPPVAVRPG